MSFTVSGHVGGHKRVWFTRGKCIFKFFVLKICSLIIHLDMYITKKRKMNLVCVRYDGLAIRISRYRVGWFEI